MSDIYGRNNNINQAPYGGDPYNSGFNPYVEGQYQQYQGGYGYNGNGQGNNLNNPNGGDNAGILLELREILSGICSFKGRTRRRVWWIGGSELMAITMIFMALGFAVISKGSFMIGSAVCFIAQFFTVLVMFPASVRRLHDVGKSGWFILLSFIPIGNIVVLIMMYFLSSQSDNMYGPDPKRIPFDRYPLQSYGAMMQRNLWSAVTGMVVISIISTAIYTIVIYSMFIPYVFNMKGIGGILGQSDTVASDYMQDDDFFKVPDQESVGEDSPESSDGSGQEFERSGEKTLDEDVIQVKGPFSFERGVNSQDITVGIINKEPHPVRYSLFIEGTKVTSNLVQEIAMNGAGIGFAVTQIKVPVLTDAPAGRYPVTLTLVDENERVAVKKFEVEIKGGGADMESGYDDGYMSDDSYVITGGMAYEVGVDIPAGEYEVQLMDGKVTSIVTNDSQGEHKVRYTINLGFSAVEEGTISEGGIIELETGDLISSADGGSYRLIAQ